MSGHRKFSTLQHKPVTEPVERMQIEQAKRASLIAAELGKLRERRDTNTTADRGMAPTHGVHLTVDGGEDDVFLSTLRYYVQSLGGQLELAAVFPDQRVLIEPAATANGAPESAAKPNTNS